MARAPDKRIEKAYELYKQGMKLVDIANSLNLPEGTVRRWKCTHKWDSERSEKKSERSERRKGAPKDNKNAAGHGAPDKNKNAEKHGLFSKYLPEETMDIVKQMTLNPLDILWDNIQISYAAIIRAQQIMYVKDRNDKTVEKIEEKCGNIIGERWEVQQAWDKQASFLQAQARAQSELRSLIKQYDEMLHKNWDLASEEQKARIEKIKAETAMIKKSESDDDIEIADDGFLEALNGTASEDWADEED